MKTRLLSAWALFCALNSFSQRRHEGFIMWPIDATTQKIVFKESLFMPGFSADALYANAKNFADNSFKELRDGIVANDTTKTVTCTGAFFIPVAELGERGKGYIRFTLTIWCHKNAYRYMLTDLQHFALNADGVVGGPLENEKTASGAILFPRQYWNAEKARCYYRIQNTIERLKEAMNRHAES